ncbi:MAG TPA: hypothetical protein VF846_18190 [Thermoanaerobaculia bacterium]|jgi:hypothetical protein
MSSEIAGRRERDRPPSRSGSRIFDGDISEQGTMSQTNLRAVMEMAKELDALMIFPLMHVNLRPSAAPAANSQTVVLC